MERTKKIAFLLIAAVLTVLLASCSTTVERVERGSMGDLTGDWNENDVDIVCESLLRDMMDSPALYNWTVRNEGELPVIRVGKFANESHDHLDTSIVTTGMQNAIMNSGRAYFAADRSFMEDVTEEIEYGLDNVKLDEMKSAGNQTAVDFLLQGSVKSIVQKDGKKEIKTYYVTAQLTDIESGIMIWQGQNKDISKYIKGASVRW